MDGLNRNIEHKIKDLLESFPIVVILGVRHCGKSTVSKMVGDDWKYYDLENPAHFDLIDNDPLLFFKENDKQVIIDETQINPQIFNVLRTIIDQNRNQNGRFIFTGSSSFELINKISESLAGRVAIVELATLKIKSFVRVIFRQ
jgi:predicted AAA+ superfamily ATPase